jgi:hypothetical protein
MVTCGKEDTDACEDYTRGRKCLPKIRQRMLEASHMIETYQTNAPRDGSRKSVEDVHSWGQPLGQSLIATVRFVELSNLILKDSNNGGS